LNSRFFFFAGSFVQTQLPMSRNRSIPRFPNGNQQDFSFLVPIDVGRPSPAGFCFFPPLPPACRRVQALTTYTLESCSTPQAPLSPGVVRPGFCQGEGTFLSMSFCFFLSHDLCHRLTYSSCTSRLFHLTVQRSAGTLPLFHRLLRSLEFLFFRRCGCRLSTIAEGRVGRKCLFFFR